MSSARSEHVQIIAVLVIAATLRMTFPGLTEFKADEARLYDLAYDLASGEQLPLHGIGSSIGIPNFPLSAWLYALPITLWKHPYAPTVFTGLLNTVAVFACWWFTRRYWGAHAGIIAALLFAVSPWAVIFSRKIWAQNMLPLFVLGWAITGIMAFADGKRRAALGHGVLLGCVTQIHFSGLPLLMISAATALICRRRLAWGWLAAGTAIAAAIAAPLALHFRAQGLPPWPIISASPIPFRLDSMLFTWMLSTGSDIHSLAGISHNNIHLQIAHVPGLVHWIWGTLIAIGIWRFLYTRIATQRFAARFVIAWLVSPALILLWSPVAVYPHYFIITFPAQYIAAAVGASALLEQLRHRLHRVTGWGLLLASGGVQIWTLVTLFQFITLRATPEGYGSPLWMKLAVVDSVRTSLNTGPATEVLIVGNGNNPATHQFPAVYGTLLRGTPHRFVDAAASAVRTVNPSLVLLQNELHPAVQYYLAWSTQVTSIPMRAGEDAVKLLELPPLTTEILPRRKFTSPNTLANGVTLLGYQQVHAHAGLSWEVHWIASDAINENYHFYNHLLDSNRQRLGQADSPSFPAHQWRQGDRMISFFSTLLDNPPETLLVGMYTYPDLDNIPLVDGSGNIVAQAMGAQWNSP